MTKFQKKAEKKKKSIYSVCIIAVLDFIKQTVHQYSDFNASDPKFKKNGCDTRQEKIEMWLELDKGHDIDNCQWMEVRKPTPKKLWCVVITNNDDVHNPIVLHVRAKTQSKAYQKAMDTLPITLTELDNDDDHDILGIEVEESEIIN